MAVEPEALKLRKAAQGLATVVQRRGFGYFGYLLGGVAWPNVAYRFGWGPKAPAILQAAFAAAGELVASKVDPGELRRLGLIADANAPAANDADAWQIEALMDRAHAAGITGVSGSFRHLVRTAGGRLAFGDLEKARKHRPDSLHFLSARDADRRAFNREFGASVLTEASARDALRDGKSKVPDAYQDYAPIDFGCGLTVGQVASTDSGTGRWDFFNRQIVAPLIAGKRVLDLGSNNGSLPLMMLRDGAREVVAVEFTPEIADFARINARILSWRDVRPYDIKVLAGDMRLFLTEDLGAFDVITAFCSLYYLPEEDMARIVSKAASMNAVLILQANDTIDNLPAQALALHRLMRENGYADVEVHTPAGFARPLLVGYTYRQMAATSRHRDLPQI